MTRRTTSPRRDRDEKMAELYGEPVARPDEKEAPLTGCAALALLAFLVGAAAGLILFVNH